MYSAEVTQYEFGLKKYSNIPVVSYSVMGHCGNGRTPLSGFHSTQCGII